MWKNVEKCGKNVEKSIKSISKQNQKELILFEKSPQNICNLCCKTFSRNDSLQRHLSVCKLNNYSNKFQQIPKKMKNEQKNVKNSSFQCQFCQSYYSTQYNLNKHVRKCVSKQNEIAQLKLNYEKKLVEKDLENKDKLLEQQQKTIDIVQKIKPSVTNITNNTTNKTINYLNTNYGEMIAMDKFLYNLQHTEQLTQQEREQLLMAYKDSGIELFARSFSHVMKENCRRQLLKEGLPEMDIIPLYCSDGNLRSHKEKNSQGWKTHYDNNSLNSMINISSDQVYQSCRKPLMIFGKERNKVFKQIKQDNHAQKNLGSQQLEDNKLVV